MGAIPVSTLIAMRAQLAFNSHKCSFCWLLLLLLQDMLTDACVVVGKGI
jgi:hypothetical protein